MREDTNSYKVRCHDGDVDGNWRKLILNYTDRTKVKKMLAGDAITDGNKSRIGCARYESRSMGFL